MLGLAGMIMALDLPVRLRLLIPAVENAIAGNAYRPMDVIRTRKGLTVEIGHTDAEGGSSCATRWPTPRAKNRTCCWISRR